jgi:hypothetical protein
LPPRIPLLFRFYFHPCKFQIGSISSRLFFSSIILAGWGHLL